MTLAARFRLQRGALTLDAAMEVAEGTTLAVVGPNGAGKSTLLAALAGLLPIDVGRIALAGTPLDDPDTGVFVPPERRHAGVVFQDPLLFPHLSVLDNVAYGGRARGRARARREAVPWLERVGLERFAAAGAATLSGGQAQRVALARALAARPRMLLLDEPLSAVDASARLALRRLLRRELEDFTGPRVVVAHDPRDAFALADRVAVLEGGRVVQTGSAAGISAHPRSDYVADLVGLNLMRGRARDGVATLAGGGALVTASAHEGEVLLTVHPRAVSLFDERPVGSPRNVWRAPVTDVEAAGASLRVRLGGEPRLVAEVTPSARADLALAPGREVWVAVKATEIGVSPA